MRWNLKEAGCGEPTNPRANLWSDEQKPHIRLCMRVSLPYKIKPDNYTESCAVNVADRWRESDVWYQGRSRQQAETEYETCSNNEWREVSRSHSTKTVANVMGRTEL